MRSVDLTGDIDKFGRNDSWIPDEMLSEEDGEVFPESGDCKHDCEKIN